MVFTVTPINEAGEGISSSISLSLAVKRMIYLVSYRALQSRVEVKHYSRFTPLQKKCCKAEMSVVAPVLHGTRTGTVDCSCVCTMHVA